MECHILQPKGELPRLGGAIAGLGEAYHSETKSKEGYLWAATVGAVFGFGAGMTAEADDLILDAVLSAASESGANAALGLWNFFVE